jgi:hypothetical protein
MNTISPEVLSDKVLVGTEGREAVAKSVYAAADIYYLSAPWKYIPGPWALVTTVKSKSKFGDITRVAAVAGASNSDSRGLQLFHSVEAYSMMNRDASLHLMFRPQRDIPPQHWKHLASFDHSFSAKMAKVVQYPVFLNVSRSGAKFIEEDFVWYESALPALSTFIEECSRLGGGGHKDITRPPLETPLEPIEVLASVVEPHMANMVNPGGTQTNLADTFPCVQTISSAFGGDTTVTITVLPTQTVIATANNTPPVEVQRIADTNVFKEPLPPDFEMSEETSRMCAVCRKTESDIRSRGGKGLQLCICRAVGLRYCSKECQKEDWKRHKKVCAGKPKK